MLIEHIGHAEFLLTLESGFRIVTDPYDASTGYPVRVLEADGVLVSHHHHDHDAVENVSGAPQVIDYAGLHTFAPGLTVTGIRADHDDAGGAKRGNTLLFLLEAEDLRLAHLGDLGCLLSPEQLEALGRVEALLTEPEADVARRARNARQTPPRNADPGEYHRATALEALIGYLYVTGQRDRMNVILAAALPDAIFTTEA